MKKTRIFSLLLALCALIAWMASTPKARAAENDFNGTWDLEVHSAPININFTAAKDWWLGISGAGTPDMKIQFVGSPDGSLDDITQSSFQNGVLHFTWVSRNGDERI